MEELKIFIDYVGHQGLLMTLIPSLFLNVIIDIVRKYIFFKTRNEEKLVLVGLLSLFGLVFGFLYYYILGIDLNTCCIHAGFITILSYFFYKIDIYKLLYKIIVGILNKIGVKINE